MALDDTPVVFLMTWKCINADKRRQMPGMSKARLLIKNHDKHMVLNKLISYIVGVMLNPQKAITIKQPRMKNHVFYCRCRQFFVS